MAGFSATSYLFLMITNLTLLFICYCLTTKITFMELFTPSPDAHETNSFELPPCYFPDDYHLFIVEWKEDAIEYDIQVHTK